MIISEMVVAVKCRCMHPSHFTAITAFVFDHLCRAGRGRRFLQLVFGVQTARLEAFQLATHS